MAALGRWEEAVHRDDLTAVPCAFVAKLAQELAPARIGNGLAEVMIAQHPAHMEVFDDQDLVFIHQSSGQLVQEVAALAAHLLVLNRDRSSRSLAAVGPWPASRQPPLQALEALLCLAQITRRRNLLARREGREVGQPQIHPDDTPTGDRRLGFGPETGYKSGRQYPGPGFDLD